MLAGVHRDFFEEDGVAMDDGADAAGGDGGDEDVDSEDEGSHSIIVWAMIPRWMWPTSFLSVSPRNS